MQPSIDISENALLEYDREVLEQLLRDHTTGRNIIWATDDYAHLGDGYQATDEITIEKITGEHGKVIQPRAVKSKEAQRDRTKERAEVFTPSWICNAQNNLVDNAWFGREGVFNTENPDHTWTVNPNKIEFPKGKTWRDYVRDTRLEITCGEAPYLVSLYDAVSGTPIAVSNRIGILDRKLRVVNENVDDHAEWLEWAQAAFQSAYGFEWQGDSLLLAREALLQTFFDYHEAKFGKDKTLQMKSVRYIAYIISWNLWQMDGLKGVIPNSCGERRIVEADLFGEKVTIEKCKGCANGDIRQHNGIYALVKDWNAPKSKQKIRFIDLIAK
ncbi:MAG: restriction endonuclease subunit M [Bacteroidales bacterium]|nr:restriction endonuclease subunit M [Bacteroidales bacterium]